MANEIDFSDLDPASNASAANNKQSDPSNDPAAGPTPAANSNNNDAAGNQEKSSNRVFNDNDHAMLQLMEQLRDNANETNKFVTDKANAGGANVFNAFKDAANGSGSAPSGDINSSPTAADTNSDAEDLTAGAGPMPANPLSSASAAPSPAPDSGGSDSDEKKDFQNDNNSPDAKSDSKSSNKTFKDNDHAMLQLMEMYKGQSNDLNKSVTDKSSAGLGSAFSSLKSSSNGGSGAEMSAPSNSASSPALDTKSIATLNNSQQQSAVPNNVLESGFSPASPSV